MTREETKIIINGIIVAFPNYKIPDLHGNRIKNLSAVVDMYFGMLKEYDYKIVTLALKAYISSDKTGFAPSIGQLIAEINKLTIKDNLSDLEAWGLVSKAIRNGYYGAVEEFEKLPPLVQKAVGSCDNLRNWSTSDVNSVETVIQSNFLSTYRSIRKKQEEFNCLPLAARQLIEKTNSAVEQIEEKMMIECN